MKLAKEEFQMLFEWYMNYAMKGLVTEEDYKLRDKLVKAFNEEFGYQELILKGEIR